jgi:imidazole glycerol-phosphate synthase subunit HisF
MLKTRILPTLLFKDFGLVKGVSFDSWRRVGTVTQAVKVYNMRGVDELVFLDINATREDREPDFETVDDIADECFMPLTVGGGVRTVDDARRLLRVGADKVAINTAAVTNPELITAIANELGAQCVVVSIDVKKVGPSSYEVFTHAGTRATGRDPVTHARHVAELGAGEILLGSVDRDGTMSGYEIDVIREVTRAVSIPVIASGGAGTYEHLASAILEGGASAVAAASIFHFTEQTPMAAKEYLRERGVNVRL